jgi:hypothetical protein
MKIPTIALLFVLLGGCAGWGHQSARSDWQTIEVNDLFTFRLPAGFVKQAATSDRGERVEYSKAETKVVAIWGRTESGAFADRRQSWMNDYTESTTRIRGLRANIRTYSHTVNAKRIYRAELNLGNWQNGEVQLYLRVEGTDLSTLDTAREIFKSVTLPLPPPERSPF